MRVPLFRLLSFVAALVLSFALTAQTAAFAQAQVGKDVPEAAPGLYIPSTVVPWALDEVDGQPALVPVHHASVTVNRHTGKNIAGGLAGSFFYHPELTTELKGAHARTQLHTSTPALYFLFEQDNDPEEPAKAGDKFALELLPAKVVEDHRVITKTTFNALTTHGKHKDDPIQTTIDVLPGHWTRLTPKAPLPPGEYVLLWEPVKGEQVAVTVFPFGIDPKAPVSNETVHPGDTPRHNNDRSAASE